MEAVWICETSGVYAKAGGSARALLVLVAIQPSSALCLTRVLLGF